MLVLFKSMLIDLLELKKKFVAVLDLRVSLDAHRLRADAALNHVALKNLLPLKPLSNGQCLSDISPIINLLSQLSDERDTGSG